MPSSRTKKPTSGRQAVASPRTWIFLVIFAAVVALFGGASRFDAVQIVPLRGASALFLIPALVLINRSKVRGEAFLLATLGLFVALVAIQLIPLPPGLWQALPWREPVAEIDALLGYDGLWRPLSLAPMRTWNVFGSLIVPVVGLLLAVAIAATTRLLLQIIAGLGLLNAVLGLLQVISGRSSPLYFYDVTNYGSSVGVFANENHSAIFAVCSLMVVARLAIEAHRERQAMWLRLLYPAAYFFIFLVALISGSRAGFAASMGALVITGFMVWLSWLDRPARGQSRRNASPRVAIGSRLLLLLPILGLILTIGAFIALGRVPAVQDILARDSFADLRWSILPVLQDMVSAFWLLGTGFGSFEQAFHIFEPSSILFSKYINQAHNDWIQLLIEGGIVAAALLVALLVWTGKSVVRLSRDRVHWVAAVSWIGIFGVVGAASLVDYPLRTPTFQLVMVWMLLALSRDGRVQDDTRPANL